MLSWWWLRAFNVMALPTTSRRKTAAKKRNQPPPSHHHMERSKGRARKNLGLGIALRGRSAHIRWKFFSRLKLPPPVCPALVVKRFPNIEDANRFALRGDSKFLVFKDHQIFSIMRLQNKNHTNPLVFQNPQKRPAGEVRKDPFKTLYSVQCSLSFLEPFLRNKCLSQDWILGGFRPTNQHLENTGPPSRSGLWVLDTWTFTSTMSWSEVRIHCFVWTAHLCKTNNEYTFEKWWIKRWSFLLGKAKVQPLCRFWGR